MRTGRPADIRLVVVLGLLAVLITGCAGSLSDGRRWGADATWRPGWARVWSAAATAALDARTLVPAAAAGVLSIGHLDRELSDAAADRTPVFGSRSSALTYSDVMRGALLGEAIITGFTTPSGDLDREWWMAKLKGLLVEGGAIGATEGVTQILQRGTGRTRPDGSDDRSFPSGHASSSFAAAAQASSNLATLGLDPGLRTILEVTNTAAATSVAWARVEGRKHFPTDVLVGASLGNFLGLFVHKAFLGTPKEDSSYWRIFPIPGGAMLELGWKLE
jgi:membrane-associated phospholipid phosphatase